MTDQTTLFADGMMEANVTHGVVRITLAQAGADGKPQAAGKLVMPLVQLPAFANSLIGLLRQVESKLKEAQQATGQAAGQASGAPAVAPSPTPSITAGGEAPAAAPTVNGAFRFGS